MPTYRNDTAGKITHQGKGYMEWMPGEVKALGFFVPYKSLGLTLADPLPKVCEAGVLGYWEIRARGGERKVLELPYCEVYELSVSAAAGSVKMFVGDGEVPVLIGPSHDHISTYAWDMTAYLTFEGVTRMSELYVKMETRFAGERRR